MTKISTFGMNAAFQLGFERIADVRGVTSVVSLFNNSMILSGVYLQIRPNQVAYIGKTNNMPARFDQHLARGVVIEELAFMPVLAKYVDNKEKQLIALAEKKGIPLENIALRDNHTTRTQTLETIFSLEEINKWLTPEEKSSQPNLWHLTYQSMHPGLKHQFDTARAHPIWPQIFPIAKTFVQKVIPKPEDTREDFWSAQAYTRNAEQDFISIIRIHAGSLTLLNLGSYRIASFDAWGWLTCKKSDLMHYGYTLSRLKTELPFANIIEKEELIQIQTSARLLIIVIEKLKPALRKTAFEAMQNALLQKGNPALECLLTIERKES